MKYPSRKKMIEFIAEQTAEAETDDGAYDFVYNAIINGVQGLKDSSDAELKAEYREYFEE